MQRSSGHKPCSLGTLGGTFSKEKIVGRMGGLLLRIGLGLRIVGESGKILPGLSVLSALLPGRGVASNTLIHRRFEVWAPN